nr:toprim domain-containing protein [Helicobacter rodentium]
MGAIWDAKEKKFFAPYYLDQNLFSKWNKENTQTTQKQKSYNAYQNIDTNKALAQFKNALQSQGFIVDTPIMNGKIQRCKVEGDRDNEKSGAYLGHLNEYPAGFIQNHKTGYKTNWKFELSKDYTNDTNNISPQKYSNKDQKAKQKELEILSLQMKTALRLEKEWNESKPAPNSHSYLKIKKLNTAYDLKVDKFNNLLIPLKDVKGRLWSLQRINENGSKVIGVIKTKEEKEKNIEYSARKKGCFYTQIPLNEHNEFIICEGFATAMTLQEILNQPTIMAVDAGNLENVITSLKQEFPTKKITIFADNDKNKELENKENVGLKYANIVKEKFQEIDIIFPRFNEEDLKAKMSDFNDLYIKYGKEYVVKQIEQSKEIQRFSFKKTQKELER